MTTTNIKNLPENAKYMTLMCYSDSKPYVVVKETAKTKVISPVRVTKDPEWKPDFHVGGFAAHCSNQSSQTWIYDGVDEDTQIRVYKTKRGWSRKTHRFAEDRAVYFYDYNF
jgi:hypothetical protein